eukprot:5895736-Heterocapsa_arctica.AAC.1
MKDQDQDRPAFRKQFYTPVSSCLGPGPPSCGSDDRPDRAVGASGGDGKTGRQASRRPIDYHYYYYYYYDYYYYYYY